MYLEKIKMRLKSLGYELDDDYVIEFDVTLSHAMT